MIRKLISLPEDLDRLIELTALKEHKPQAAVIREKLHAGFAIHKPVQHKNHPLLVLAENGVSGLDPDISTNIDKYLYDE